jgi:dTMP kinase
MAPKPGRFILFEGLDRVGKTTQATKLVEYLGRGKHGVVYAKLPDRSTQIGKIIDNYLQSKTNTTPQVAQLLFCANRWEVMPGYIEMLKAGTDIVMDRYIYSAIAYGAANGLDAKWIGDMEYGLPVPDMVIMIDVPHDTIRERSKNDQSERYETLEMQKAVKKQFDTIYIPNKVIIDGTDTVDKVHTTIVNAIELWSFDRDESFET